jgi:iron complex outermembrane recepter protein
MTPIKFRKNTLSTLISLAVTGALAAPAVALADDSDTELPRLVVTSDPIGDRSPDEIIQPVTVVSGDKLERRRAATLGEMLDGLPGVANSDFGPGVGRPVVRGLQGSRVQVLEDGLSTADVSGEGADHAIAIDPSHARQVEVFRGPSTLLYGSGAAGGVINVVTNRFSPVSGERFGVEGGFSYGFNGKDKQGRVALEAPFTDGFVLRTDYGIRRSSDFDIKGFQQVDQTAGNRGTLRISSVDTESASASGVFRGDWGHIGLGVSTWETDYGIPENFDARPRDMGGQSDHFERVFAEYDRFDLRAEFNEPFGGIAKARFKLAYTQFEQEEVEFEFDRSPTGGSLDEAVVEAAFKNDEYDSRLELVHNPIGDWRGVIGLQYRDRDFEADDPRGADRGFYVRPVRTRTTSLFVIEELPTDFGRVELGARVEWERSNPEDVLVSRVGGVTLADGSFRPLPQELGSRTFTPFSISGGTIVNVGDDYHLRAALTRAQRAPSAEQLYAFGRHAAAGTFEVGDLDLSMEAYNNLEIGFDRHRGPFRFDATAFYNRVNNFIFLASEDDGTGNPVFVNDIGNRAGEGAAANCAPGAGGLCRLRNQFVVSEQGNAEFYGVEFAGVADVVDGPVPVSLRVSADHVRGKLRSGDNLPRITPTRVGFGLDTGFGDWDLSVDFQRVFKQSNTAEVESETSGYNLLGFDLFWRPVMFEGIQVFAKGRNLLNEDGRRHQSFLKEEAPIIGRAFTTGLRFQF